VCPSDCCSVDNGEVVSASTTVLETDTSVVIGTNQVSAAYQSAFVSAVSSFTTSTTGATNPIVTVTGVTTTANAKKQSSYSIEFAYTIDNIGAAGATSVSNSINTDSTEFSTAVSAASSTSTYTTSTSVVDVDTDAPAIPDSKMDSFSCSDGAVLSVERVCDGVKNCPDGEDEMFCEF